MPSFFFIAHTWSLVGFSIPTARRFSSNVTKLRLSRFPLLLILTPGLRIIVIFHEVKIPTTYVYTYVYECTTTSMPLGEIRIHEETGFDIVEGTLYWCRVGVGTYIHRHSSSRFNLSVVVIFSQPPCSKEGAACTRWAVPRQPCLAIARAWLVAAAPFLAVGVCFFFTGLASYVRTPISISPLGIWKASTTNSQNCCAVHGLLRPPG